MLERAHYELLAKYDSAENISFDVNELTLVCSLLDLRLSPFTESRLSEYRASIVEAIHQQNRVWTELGGEYLDRSNRGLEIEAYEYVVRNIGKITSPFLLDCLIGLIGYKPGGPLHRFHGGPSSP